MARAWPSWFGEIGVIGRSLPAACVAGLLAVLLEAGGALSQPRLLTLESIVIQGNSRTSDSLVLENFPIEVGAAIEAVDLLDAVAALRASELFASVDFLTAPGSERGRVRLELDVTEKGLEFRFGTGYRDLDGWYLIPAQLRADNRFGHGEQIRLQARIGYHVSGVELVVRQQARPSRRTDWGLSLAGEALDRPYFLDGIEYRQAVSRGSLGAYAGYRLASSWRIEAGASIQSIEVDPVPIAREDDPVRGVSRGDALPYDELPADVAADLDDAERTIVHGVLEYDTRSDREVASTPSAGMWGRVRSELFLRRGADFGSVTADLRAYRAVLGGVAVFRARGGGIAPPAAFYDRFHLGGLYTIRGVPSQSLSRPGGDTRFWSSSLEFRAPLVGRRDDPRLGGVLFVDAGDAWIGRDATFDDVTVTAGWGFRIRVPWIRSVGMDVGFPLTDSPVGESFHANAALGWNF